MLKFPRTRFLVIAIAILTMFGIPLFGFSQGVQSASLPALPRVWQRSFGGWHYAGYVDEDGYVNGAVWLESETVVGVKNYAAANKALAEQLWQSGQQTMQVVVIFKHPLSIAELSALRARIGITIQSVEGRLSSANGERETVFWVVDNQSDLNSSVLDNAKTDISAKSGSAQFAGLYSFQAVISRNSYDRLVNESVVFVIDVTVNQIQRDMVNNIAIEKFSLVNRPNVFWTMEDLGLGNFQ